MKHKLIDTKRSRLDLSMAIIVLALLALGMLLIIIKGLSAEYIDDNGLLHENFFLLPIGFLFIFSAIIIFVVMLINKIRIKIRGRRCICRNDLI